MGSIPLLWSSMRWPPVLAARAAALHTRSLTSWYISPSSLTLPETVLGVQSFLCETRHLRDDMAPPLRAACNFYFCESALFSAARVSDHLQRRCSPASTLGRCRGLTFAGEQCRDGHLRHGCLTAASLACRCTKCRRCTCAAKLTGTPLWEQHCDRHLSR